MKGKENVLSEVNLMMICYNLTRLTSILSPNELKLRLKSIRLVGLYPLYPILAHLIESFYLKLNSFAKVYQFKRSLNHNLLSF